MKKKIAWITPEYFIDVDLPIINKISNIMDVRWIIAVSCHSTIDYESFVHQNLDDEKKITISFVYLRHRSISPLLIVSYLKILKEAKRFSPDIYYTSFYGLPYALPLYKICWPSHKCVAACHNVTTPKGATMEKYASIYTHWWLSSFKHIQVFSKSQYEKLLEKYKGKGVLLAPLAIKDYGEPTKIYNKEDSDIIRFLFFGNIVDYKRLDILIQAVNILREKNIHQFKVRIAGSCKQWDKYQAFIKYPDSFELRIERIPNEEVADLFADSHYFVMPYQDIAQSGAITVAFRYNLPVIVSDIEPFKEFVEEGKTGLTFKSLNAKDLAKKMLYVLEHHKEIYPSLCKQQNLFVQKELSITSIVNRYMDYFNKL